MKHVGKEELERKFLWFRRWSWIMLAMGVIAMASGLVRFILLPASVTFSLTYRQPILQNGTFHIILGLLLIGIGLYRLLNAKKEFEIRMEEGRDIDSGSTRKGRNR
ncbi:MAG: hypothetical protein ACK5XV_06570 [Flavobacteriales bacterium]